MPEHLPECLVPDFDKGLWICICNQLRACEKRVHKIAYQQGLGAGSDEHGQHEIGWMKGYDAAIAECISLGHRHIDRINEEAKAAISEQVASQLFMNADGIEFLVGELRAIQEKR
jgi:hypothetical protein